MKEVSNPKVVLKRLGRQEIVALNGYVLDPRLVAPPASDAERFPGTREGVGNLVITDAANAIQWIKRGADEAKGDGDKQAMKALVRLAVRVRQMADDWG